MPVTWSVSRGLATGLLSILGRAMLQSVMAPKTTDKPATSRPARPGGLGQKDIPATARLITTNVSRVPKLGLRKTLRWNASRRNAAESAVKSHA